MSKPRKQPTIDEWKNIGPKVISELEKSNSSEHKALAAALLIPITKLRAIKTSKTKILMLQLLELSKDIPKHYWTFFKRDRAKINYITNNAMSTIQVSHDLKTRIKSVASDLSYECIIETLLESFNEIKTTNQQNSKPNLEPVKKLISSSKSTKNHQLTSPEFPRHIDVLINEVAKMQSSTGEAPIKELTRLKDFSDYSGIKDMGDRIASAVSAKIIALEEHNDQLPKSAFILTDCPQIENRTYESAITANEGEKQASMFYDRCQDELNNDEDDDTDELDNDEDDDRDDDSLDEYED
jgi:hypothetical protein